MAVQEQTPLREYTANGVTTSFALGFDCEETNHLIVTIDDVEVLPTDWYLSGSNVVFWTAPGNGKLIKLQRNTPFNRLVDYQSYNNSFRPPAINKEFDRIWWKLQELGVADWILHNRIDALKAYVDQQDSELQQNIDNLKIYVDDKDDELRAYLMEEIRKQGVALDQLDDYYNYLMQRLAQIAVDKGWEASFVVDASGRNQQQINDEVVSIFRFGGICDGTLHTAQEWVDSGKFSNLTAIQFVYPTATSLNDSIDTLALEAAIIKIGNVGHIRLGGIPVLSRKISFPVNANGIRIFADNMIQVKHVHNGDGFELALANENVGKNTLENLWIIGPDPTFPPKDYVRKSQGAGIKINRAYDNTFINVFVSGFKWGWWLHTGFNNKGVGFFGAIGNQIGFYIAGGATNLNKFDDAKIRLNSVCGVEIYGGDTGPYPTRNSFKNAYIESNIPYDGGYLEPPLDGSHSVGVKINRAYANDFTGVYFENQDFDVWLENQASYNVFKNIRQAPGGANNIRQCKIMLKGANVNSNDFTGAEHVSWDTTTPSVISDSGTQYGNKFIDTVGYNFIESSMLSYNNTVIRNNSKHTLIHGTQFGAITRDPQGYLANPNATSGLSGIGTTNATLNVKGYGEVMLGNQITGATTITEFTGAKPGQIIILKNYQITHPVTIKASTNGTSGLVLNGRRDCILSAYSDSITFFVSGLGKIVEIGRTVQATAPVEQSVGTWTPVVKNSGGSTIATSSATGRWVRNGRQLTVWFDIAASADLTEANYYSITGMPNLPQFEQKGAGQAASATNPANANQKDVFGVDATTSELRVRVSTQANFSNSDGFSGCATYIIT